MLYELTCQGVEQRVSWIIISPSTFNTPIVIGGNLYPHIRCIILLPGSFSVWLLLVQGPVYCLPEAIVDEVTPGLLGLAASPLVLSTRRL